MDSFEEEMAKFEKRKKEKQQKFYDKCLSKITDGAFAYKLLCEYACKRFKVDSSYGIPSPIHIIVEHFINEVDGIDFDEWTYHDNAPFIRHSSELPKIFHEFTNITTVPHKIVDLANSIYGLDLELDFEEEYVYSLNFNFNDFTPLDVDAIRDIKTEIEFCKKYEIDYTHLTDQLHNFGLTYEQLKRI